MTAKEMFDILGYEQTCEKSFNHTIIRYFKDDDNVIYFDLDDKTFYKRGHYYQEYDDINMEELKAINKQCEELGWL